MKTFKLLNIFIIILCLIPQTLYSQLKKTSEIEKVKSFTNGSIILSKIKINEVYIYALTIPNNSKYHEDIVFYLGEEKDVLNSIFGEPEYAEYFMKKRGAFVPGSFKEKRMYEFEQDGKKIGRCKLQALFSGWYLHAFIIQEEYRNQGIGTKFLDRILQALTVQKENSVCAQFTDVFLQVSSRNIPAVTLYEHAGFEISEQRNFYSYKTMVKRK